MLRISPWEKPLVSYNPWFWVAVEGLQLCPVFFPAAYLYNPVILFKGIVFLLEFEWEYYTAIYYKQIFCDSL